MDFSVGEIHGKELGAYLLAQLRKGDGVCGELVPVPLFRIQISAEH